MWYLVCIAIYRAKLAQFFHSSHSILISFACFSIVTFLCVVRFRSFVHQLWSGTVPSSGESSGCIQQNMSHLACLFLQPFWFELSRSIRADRGRTRQHRLSSRHKKTSFFQAVKMISAACQRVQSLAGDDVHDRPIFRNLLLPFVLFWCFVGETLLLIRQPPSLSAPAFLA